MNRLVKVAVFTIAAFVFLPSIAAAQPAAVSSVVARDGEAVGFRWGSVLTATWYHLWVSDANGNVYEKWYTSEDLHCGPGQTTECRTGVVLNAMAGQITWWVRTWSPDGFGPWSAGQVFTPGPLFSVVGADGVIARGTAVSATKLGAGNYEVLFSRDVTNCLFIAQIGGTTTDVPHGMASATRRSGAANGVFVLTKDIEGVTVDKPFHLLVTCR